MIQEKYMSSVKSGLNDFISQDVDGLQMMNLLDPDIPLEYLLPPDLPFAESYEQGMTIWHWFVDVLARGSLFKMYDSRGRPIDTSKFKIFENHDDHKNQNSQKGQQKPKTIPKPKTLFTLQPLSLQTTESYSDMAKTLGLYNW